MPRWTALTGYPPDSVRFEGLTAKDSVPGIDLFGNHLLTPVDMGPVERNEISPDWFFPLLLIILSAFAVLRFLYSKYFSQMFQALVNNNLTNQIVRDENILVQRASLYLSIVFNFVASLYLYVLSINLGWEMGGMGHGFGRFVFFLVLVTAVYALKFLILKICGWLFDTDREMTIYIFNIFLINNFLGIVLLPLIFIISWSEILPSPALIMISVIVAAIAFGYRILRGILIGLNGQTVSPLYLFLYLCTLEIVPLMVLLRIVL